jgi:hypothetical protein
MTDPLDRYLDDFGTRLDTASANPPRRRLGRPALALAATVAAAALTVVLLTGSGEPLDPVAEARAALTAPGEIVYMKLTSRANASRGVVVSAPPQTSEQWTTEHPRRWRLALVSEPAKHGTPARRAGDVQQLSYADGTSRSYTASRRSMLVMRGLHDGDPRARLPSILGPGTGDPATDLRSVLDAAGEVRDEGEVRSQGRTVRRLVRDERAGGVLRLRLVYDVDPKTFAPVGATLSRWVRSRGVKPRMLSVRIRVDAYKRIPLNDTTAKLLEIDTPPGTKVVVR